MMKRCVFRRISIMCVMVALLASCSRSPRVMFYTLDISGTAESAPFRESLCQSARLLFPTCSDRSQLVVRTSANNVAILESHRWAESLKSEIRGSSPGIFPP